MSFLCKIYYFHFRLLQVLMNRESDANLQGFAFFVSSTNRQCENNVTFPQLQRFWPFHTFNQLCLFKIWTRTCLFLEWVWGIKFAGWIFDHWVFTWHRLFKKTNSCANTNGAVITERNILTPLRQFIISSPFYKAVASGKRKYWVLQRNNMFKLQITLDRHNA